MSWSESEMCLVSGAGNLGGTRKGSSGNEKDEKDQDFDMSEQYHLLLALFEWFAHFITLIGYITMSWNESEICIVSGAGNLGGAREGSSGSEKDEKDQDFDIAIMPIYLQLFDALTQVRTAAVTNIIIVDFYPCWSAVKPVNNNLVK